MKDTYAKWVESHTPEQIRSANLARRLIKRRGLFKTSPRLIVDPRRVVGPVQPHIAFYQERQASGDLRGIPLRESVVASMKEFRALSASEKKVSATLIPESLIISIVAPVQKLTDRPCRDTRTRIKRIRSGMSVNTKKPMAMRQARHNSKLSLYEYCITPRLINHVQHFIAALE